MRYIMYNKFYTQCTGPEVCGGFLLFFFGFFSHELLFCKRAVLQTVSQSVECCQRCFLNEKVTK